MSFSSLLRSTSTRKLESRFVHKCHCPGRDVSQGSEHVGKGFPIWRPSFLWDTSVRFLSRRTCSDDDPTQPSQPAHRTFPDFCATFQGRSESREFVCVSNENVLQLEDEGEAYYDLADLLKCFVAMVGLWVVLQTSDPNGVLFGEVFGFLIHSVQILKADVCD